MRHSIACPRRSTHETTSFKFLPGGKPNLGFNQVNSGDHFGDRMLDLNPRIHFDEVQIAGFFAEKFHGSRARIADFLQRFDHLRANALPGGIVQHRRRRFLHHLLMAALQRAFAFAQMHHVSVIISQHLKLDVPGPLDQFFDVDIGVAESLFRFVSRRLKRGNQFTFLAHYTHSATAASGRRLDHYRIAYFCRDCFCGVLIRDDSGAARNDRKASRGHFRASAILFAHHANHFRSRADKSDVRSLAHLGKVCIFGEKTVSGMDGVHVGYFRGADHVGDVQIALAASRRTDTDGFIGEPDVKRVAVRFRVNGDGANTQLLAGSQYSQRNFAAICDQDFSKHCVIAEPKMTLERSGDTRSGRPS